MRIAALVLPWLLLSYPSRLELRGSVFETIS